MLHYSQYGNGPHYIILVHGNSQSSETWKYMAASPLLNKYSLVMVDLPGHGRSWRSRQPENDYSLKGMAAHLAGFINGLNSETYILVGNSLGTNICAEALPMLKRYCAGLFFIGASVIGGSLTSADLFQPVPALMTSFQEDVPMRQLQEFLSVALYDTTNVQKINESTAAFYDTDKTIRKTIAQCVERADWSDELLYIARAGCPLALLYGMEEKIIHPFYLEKSELNLWKKRIITVPYAGHFIHLDQPDVVAEMLAQFCFDCFD